MKPSEVSHWIERGQFWASLRPLALLRMGDVHPEDSGQAVRWTPDHDEEEMLFVFPLSPADYRYLWNTWRGAHATCLRFVVGDVWLYVDRVGEQRLVFVGPETTDREVVFHADHSMEGFRLPQDPAPEGVGRSRAIIDLRVMDGHIPELHLFQPGAGRRARPGLSAWDRVNQDDD